jgi:hypothetical protein
MLGASSQDIPDMSATRNRALNGSMMQQSICCSVVNHEEGGEEAS